MSHETFFFILHQFFLEKLTCLVTLFNRKLQFNKSETFLAFFNELLSTRNINVARFARNTECDFFSDFQMMCCLHNIVKWLFCKCVYIVLKNGPFLYGCQGRASAEERLQYFLPYQHHHHPYMDIRVNSRKPNLFKRQAPPTASLRCLSLLLPSRLLAWLTYIRAGMEIDAKQHHFLY